MRIRIPLISFALVLGIAACGPVNVEPTPSAEPTETPTAPVQSEPERLVLTADRATLLDGDGATLAEFTFFDLAADVVPVLSEVFGEPTVTTTEPGMESGERTNYDWGGLLLIDEEGHGVAPYDSDFFLVVTSAQLDGVDLVTVDGVRVGDSAVDLESRYPESSRRVSVPGQPERLDIRLGFIDHPDVEDGEPFIGVSVWVIAVPPDGTITEIRLPSPEVNFG